MIAITKQRISTFNLKIKSKISKSKLKYQLSSSNTKLPKYQAPRTKNQEPSIKHQTPSTEHQALKSQHQDLLLSACVWCLASVRYLFTVLSNYVIFLVVLFNGTCDVFVVFLNMYLLCFQVIFSSVISPFTGTFVPILPIL